MSRKLNQIILFTYNYDAHNLQILTKLPDSSRFYSQINSFHGFSSFIYVATCNRVEFYLETEQEISEQEAFRILQKNLRFKLPEVMPLIKKGPKAIHHMISMMAGLESMAIGETQIAGQFKRDIYRAMEKNLVSNHLKNLVQKVFKVQKLIRSETRIGRNPLSIISLLDKRLKNVYRDFHAEHAILGSTGDMSRKALKYLLNIGIKKLLVIRENIEKPLPEEFDLMIKKVPTEKRPQLFFLTWKNLQNLNGRNIPSFLNNFQADIFIGAAQTSDSLLNQHQVDKLAEINVIKPECSIVDLGIPGNFSIHNIDHGMYEQRKYHSPFSAGITAENHHQGMYITLLDIQSESQKNREMRTVHVSEARPYLIKGCSEIILDEILRENEDVRNRLIEFLRTQAVEKINSEYTFAVTTAKDKRILQDRLNKLNRTLLKENKKIMLDLIHETENFLSASQIVCNFILSSTQNSPVLA